MNAGNENRPPRGALIVIAIGLLATLAAAALAADGPVGEASEPRWVAAEPLPDAGPVAVPGGGEMRLRSGEVRITEGNASGYRLYRVSQVLTFSPGTAIGGGRLRCTMDVPDPPRTLVAHTPNSRASYPRGTGEDKELFDQGQVPDAVLVEFNLDGSGIAEVEFGDTFPVFTTEPGVTVEWGDFVEGAQIWNWFLPPGEPTKPFSLGFGTIWRTTGPASAQIECTLETAEGETTVNSGGDLVLPPRLAARTRG